MLRTTLLMAGTVVLAWSAQAAAAADPQAGGPGSDPPVVSASLGTVAVASGQEPTAPSSPGAPSQEDQAAAADTQTGHDFTWKWDNTLTYGLGFRLRDQDSRIIGLRSGGKAFSVNGDDGNLNYDKGMFTNAVKWTTEFQFSYKDFGGFFRAFAFYDFENENSDRVRTPLTDDAMRRVGSRAEIRDAFGYYRFKMGRMPGEIRAGWQVINWGESTFIQGGINAINPIDVSVLRVPGAELRDALLPVGAVKFSVKPTTNTSFEAFYQFTWEDLKVDPVGSYFSTTDLAGAGAQKVMLGFGSAPDYVLVGDTWVDYRGPVPGNPVGVAVPKVDADEPSQQGQYGAALRYLAEGLGGTEFGLYFINYHSRLPLIMANTGTRNALLVNGNYAGSASYFLTYPEDIQLLGGSFNTQLGRTGIALQGEVSHRWRVPLQMDDVELLYAALTPLRLLPPIPQLAPLIGLGNLLASQNQIGRYGFSEQIRGYRRFETTQAQMTATKAISQIFWADQMVLVGEVGWGRVHDLPSPSVLRLEGPGTYTSANPIFTAAGVQPGTEPTRAFPTSDAWGYVFAGRLEYGNVIGAVNMTPRMSFAHDVGGISPGPGGAFLEGRKAFTFGLGFQYQYNWELDVSYTDYFGADRYNLINDRDFIAANIKYSF